MGDAVKNLFITGTPGVGKTTLIKEVARSFGHRMIGFYTEEIMEDGVRRGFRLKTLDGTREAVLAEKGAKGPARVGKYGVHLKTLEDVAAPVLREALATPDRVAVVDEIGSMEIFSDGFREALLALLQSPRHRVLATIRRGARPFTDHVKRLEDTETLGLTRENFSEVRERVKQWLEQKIAARERL